MTTNILLQSYNVATGNIVPLGVAAGLELNDGGTAGAFQIQPVSMLGAIQALSTTGFISRTGSGTAAARTLTSAGTISFTNPAGIAGDPILDVVNSTSTQKINVDLAGSLVGTQSTVNFIQGANTSLTVANNPGSNRVDVTIAANAGSVDTFYNQSVNQTGLTTSIAAGAVGSYPLSTPSAALLALLTAGGAGTLVVTFEVAFGLIYTGSLPATIPFRLSTDANLPSPGFTSTSDVVSTVSTIAGTTVVTISQSLSSIFNVGATVLVINTQNPDSLNAMGLQNFCTRVQVQYLPVGYA